VIAICFDTTAANSGCYKDKMNTSNPDGYSFYYEQFYITLAFIPLLALAETNCDRQRLFECLTKFLSLLATGACKFIEEERGIPLLWIACCHHRIELFLGWLWAAMLGAKTTGPTEALCDRLLKWFLENDMPSKIFAENCDDIFRDEEPFWVRLRKDVAELYRKLTADGDAKKKSIPRVISSKL
jgi:hypothetical protein